MGARSALLGFSALFTLNCGAQPSAPASHAKPPSANRAAHSASLAPASATRDNPPESSRPLAATADGASNDATTFQELAVPGFLPAVVRVPKSPAKLPVLVSTHGAGGSPEAHCDYWQRIVEDRAILLCLRGKEIRRGADFGFYYPNHIVLEREFLAAIQALRAQHEERIAEHGGIYAGYSQGASMGALMIVNHAQSFEYLILIEGGFSEWSAASARKFFSNGGKKVLFACGGSHCESRAQRSADLLTKAGIEARVEHAHGAGHTYGGGVEGKVVEALPWVLGNAWSN